MDALYFIKEMLSKPALENILSEINVGVDVNSPNLMVNELIKIEKFMETGVHTENKMLALIKGLRLTAPIVGDFMSKIVGGEREFSRSKSHDLVKYWKEIQGLINGLKETEAEGELNHNVVDAVMKSLVDMKEIENFLLEKEDCSNYLTLDEEQSQALLLIKGFPALYADKGSDDVNEGSDEKFNLLIELSKELGNLPALISKACKQQALALILIGSQLSVKERAYHTWFKVKEDLCKMKESDNHAPNNHMWDVLTYCYDDLPFFLKQCFLYFACYPIGYKIPAISLTNIWIAEGFVTPEKEETPEDTANKYLEQLVRRSLVLVSKRSLLGTIKCCRLPRPIHEFAIQQSCNDGFIVVNPDKEKMESLFRLAIHLDDKNQYTEVKNNYIRSFFAFDFERNILGSALFLRVLELRNSTVPITALSGMIYLRYLGMRGSNIFELPENIGDFQNLETLDVRETSIKTLPETLWNISTLRNVYVNPSAQIKGPPFQANIVNLQILKTIVVNELWVKGFPWCLINLKKLALFNLGNLNWEYVSNLLSRIVNLHSMTIVGNIVPSEFLDLRAFPNLESLKSIKLEGEWYYCKKLFIDYIKFPPNLVKLTLTKSGLKRDPMPRLEKLLALKYLSLKDGAYTGNRMVCSRNGFPQLRFLKLSKLENLEFLEMKPKAMSQLATLRVVRCPKLNLPHNLEHVTNLEL